MDGYKNGQTNKTTNNAAISSIAFNPLSPSIQIQILQTDLHTFP